MSDNPARLNIVDGDQPLMAPVPTGVDIVALSRIIFLYRYPGAGGQPTQTLLSNSCSMYRSCIPSPNMDGGPYNTARHVAIEAYLSYAGPNTRTGNTVTFF
jgi:hypothetical protein